jgi:GNAT superfamily N-acetyltransferase
MIIESDHISILTVNPDNICNAGIYCIREKKSPGYHAKLDWFKAKINQGLKILIAVDDKGKQLGFIGYIPSEQTWRPVKAENYLFIQCIGLFTKDGRGRGIGSALLKRCEEDARGAASALRFWNLQFN